eukprot:1730898-Lingulodinium_polyedra.AAC.1
MSRAILVARPSAAPEEAPRGWPASACAGGPSRFQSVPKQWRPQRRRPIRRLGGARRRTRWAWACLRLESP